MKAAVEHLRESYAFSERRACRVLEVAVSTYRYRPTRDDGRLREQLVELARERPRFGYRRLHVMLPADKPVNHKRVWRVYRGRGSCVRLSRALAAFPGTPTCRASMRHLASIRRPT
jgi:putative transposase